MMNSGSLVIVSVSGKLALAEVNNEGQATELYPVNTTITFRPNEVKAVMADHLKEQLNGTALEIIFNAGVRIAKLEGERKITCNLVEKIFDAADLMADVLEKTIPLV